MIWLIRAIMRLTVYTHAIVVSGIECSSPSVDLTRLTLVPIMFHLLLALRTWLEDGNLARGWQPG